MDPRGSLTVVTGPLDRGSRARAGHGLHGGPAPIRGVAVTYARQFLGTKDKPPRSHRARTFRRGGAARSGTPASTVATTTEIHDQLRVLSREGTPDARITGSSSPRTRQGHAEILKACEEMRKPKGWILAPILGTAAGGREDPSERLAALIPSWTAGFVRVMIDGRRRRTRRALIRGVQTVDLVVDRVASRGLSTADRGRGRAGAAAAHGRVSVLVKGGPRLEYSTLGACAPVASSWRPLEPRHFSFQHPCRRPTLRRDRRSSRPGAAVTDPTRPSRMGRDRAVSREGQGVLDPLRTVARAHASIWTGCRGSSP